MLWTWNITFCLKCKILHQKHVSMQATPMNKGTGDKKSWGKTVEYLPSSSLFSSGTLHAIRFLAVRPSSATIFLTLSWLLERWKEAWKQEIQEQKMCVYVYVYRYKFLFWYVNFIQYVVKPFKGSLQITYFHQLFKMYLFSQPFFYLISRLIHQNDMSSYPIAWNGCLRHTFFFLSSF